MYHGYIGWFSGRPADLHPLPVAEEARRMVQLAGGRWGNEMLKQKSNLTFSAVKMLLIT